MGYRSLVICPGRGSYNRTELGCIRRAKAQSTFSKPVLNEINSTLIQKQLPTLTELDEAAHFSTRLHGKAEHAASLILGASLLDYHRLDSTQFDVVAITGNSMGWYTALACSQVWQTRHAVQIATSMAALTDASHIRGDRGMQLIYPLVDEKWQHVAERESLLEQFINQHSQEVFHSIRYGGYAVIAGSTLCMQQLIEYLPVIGGRFPMVLNSHAAFHSPFMQDAAERAMQQFDTSYFHMPSIPLIDGTGRIWTPYSACLEQLRDYTFQKQVVDCFDFSLAVQVAVKEFSPERIILLGPGNGLASVVIQALIAIGWRGLNSKGDFQAQQSQEPWLLAFGDELQRQTLTL